MTAIDSAAGEPRALVESAALSGELVDLCTRFEDALFAWMDRALAAQGETELRVPLKVAVSEVACSLTDRLLYPTYVHFPQLVPAHLADATEALNKR